MNGSPEITDTPAARLGTDVFNNLVSSGISQPFPWKLTLVGNDVVNAGSTAGGQIYVDGGLIPLLGNSPGLWAAALSHEVEHTRRRHQVAVYMRMLFNQRMIDYYRARAAAGDKSANWALVGFAVSSKLALKKMERDQESDADTQGMYLMARAGYHPDYVFALHHLLLMRSGEQSKFAAFFSDHPRWETRDQRSERAYSAALAEFTSTWPNATLSPGGSPPPVAFLGQPSSHENKEGHTADIMIPVSCRNVDEPIEVVLIFEKDNQTVKAADPQFGTLDGTLLFRKSTQCSDNEGSVLVQVPAEAVGEHDRSVKATAAVVAESGIIGQTKLFDVHFPKPKKQ